METIYSRVIWRELGLKDYKIHMEPREKTEAHIINWVKGTPLEKVNEVINSLSWISSVVNEGYYDGPFYGINQRKDEARYKDDKGKLESDLLLHDCGVIPTMLHILTKVSASPSELRFCADLLEEYQKKLPKVEGCSIDMREGDEY
jgi:hypothetical protein